MDYGLIFDEGSAAAAANAGSDDCPYATEGSCRRAWLAGWSFDRDNQLESWHTRGRADHAASVAREACPYVDGMAAETWLEGWTEAAADEANRQRTEAGQRVIDVTPTWSGLMPALLAVIEDGTDAGREAARAELFRLAAIVDEANAAARLRRDAAAEMDHSSKEPNA